MQRVLLGTYVALVLGITLRPLPVTEGSSKAVIDSVIAVGHNAGVPAAFGVYALQFVANIAMFVPLGFLLSQVTPRPMMWMAWLAVPLFSGLIELAQQLLLTARTPDGWDIFANTVGGWLGVGLALVWRRVARGRRRSQQG